MEEEETGWEMVNKMPGKGGNQRVVTLESL